MSAFCVETVRLSNAQSGAPMGEPPSVSGDDVEILRVSRDRRCFSCCRTVHAQYGCGIDKLKYVQVVQFRHRFEVARSNKLSLSDLIIYNVSQSTMRCNSMLLVNVLVVSSFTVW